MKECVLKARQFFAHVGNPPNKLTIGDKTKPLGSQRVGPKSRQPRVIGLGYLVVPFGTRKCWFQHVLLHPEG